MSSFTIWTNQGPFSILFKAPSIIVFNAIGTFIAPKEKEDQKDFARKTLKLVDKKPHIFTGDRKLKHPSRKMINSEILRNDTMACLEDEPNRVYIETNHRTPKAGDEKESQGGEKGTRTHRTPEAL